MNFVSCLHILISISIFIFLYLCGNTFGDDLVEMPRSSDEKNIPGHQHIAGLVHCQ